MATAKFPLKRLTKMAACHNYKAFQGYNYSLFSHKSEGCM